MNSLWAYLSLYLFLHFFSQVIMKKLWFNMELGAAVNDPRPQHSLFPEYIRNDRKAPLPADLVAGLEKKGHVGEKQSAICSCTSNLQRKEWQGSCQI